MIKIYNQIRCGSVTKGMKLNGVEKMWDYARV